MQTNFSSCLTFTLAQEGGYANVPGDSGHATNMGITQATLSAWLGHPASVQDMQSLTPTVAGQIYRARYWQAVNGDALPPGVDLMAFDFGVTCGPQTSVMRLQGLVKATQDGVIGPKTLAAIQAHDPRWVIAVLSYSQQVYYQSLGQPQFVAGWLARTKRREAAAAQMLAAAAPIP